MKKIFLTFLSVFLVLINTQLSVTAYYFATDVESKVQYLDEKNIELVITRLDDEDDTEVFPVGTILKGHLFEYSFNKHFVRDEYLKIHLYQAKLPGGMAQALDNDIKIKPRVLISGVHGIQVAGIGLASTLKATVAVWSVGFPVGRGIKAVTDSAFAVYDTPVEESKWKQGVKGFVRGAFFPLPDLIFKGQELPLHNESYVWIQDADADEKKLTAFIIKRKNIYLHKEKYYSAEGIEPPDFTQHLRAKDLRKYQEEQAKKAVKAKIRKAKVKDKEEAKKRENISWASENFEEEKLNLALGLQEQDLTIKTQMPSLERSWRKSKYQYQELN